MAFRVQRRNGQIGVGVREIAVPVALRHHGGQALGDAVVVMIAEYVKGNFRTVHQRVDCASLRQILNAAAGRARPLANPKAADSAGTHKQAAGIMLTHPRIEHIVVAHIVSSC